jgi:hypothetical protein
MKVRRLQLESMELARIRIEMQLAGLSIEAPMRRIQTIRNERPEMTVKREDPTIEVDMESLHNNIGLKSPMVLTQDRVAMAKSQSLQKIKDYENNGDAMAALPHKGNPIAAIARARLIHPNKPAQPSGQARDPLVTVEGHQGSLNIDWSIQDISIRWDDYQSPVITVDPKPFIDISLAQEGSVEFRVVEQSIPPETGRTIDAEA